MKPGYTPIEENKRLNFEDKADVCVASFACWVIFHVFFFRVFFLTADIFQKHLFRKKNSEISSECQTDLGPNCLQRLSTNNTSR